MAGEMGGEEALEAGDDARKAALLDELRRSVRRPVEGLFGPGSATWTVIRENALLAGGGRALLLQLAHPAVAEAVAHHSAVARDPLGRARRTFARMYRATFGTLDEA